MDPDWKEFTELLGVLFKPRDRTRARNIIKELEETLPNRHIKLTNQILSLITPQTTEDEWTKLKPELGDKYRDPSCVLWTLGQSRLQAKKEK